MPEPEQLDLRKIVRDPLFQKVPADKQQQMLHDIMAAHDETFAKLPQDARMGVAKDAMTQAQQPTTGEKVLSVAETALPAAGAAVGGVAGTASPLPFITAPVGASVGAALGQAAVEAVRPFLSDEKTSLSEGLQRTLSTGLLSGAVEGGVQMLGVGARFVGKKIAGSALGGKVSDAVMAARGMLQKYGADLLPTQLTGEKSTWLTFLSNVARNSIGGAKRFTLMQMKQDQALTSIADDIVHNAGPLGDHGLAKFLFEKDAQGQGIYQATRGLWREVKKEAWGQMEQYAPHIKVDTSGVVKIAAGENAGGIRSIIQPLRIGTTAPADFASGQIRPTTTYKNTASFSDAQDVYSELREITRLNPYPKTLDERNLVRTATLAANELKTQIDSAAGQLSGDASDAFQFANQITREGYETFHNKLITSTVKSMLDKPSNFSATLLRPNNADTINAVKTALQPDPALIGGVAQPDYWASHIQPQLAASLISRVSEHTADPVSGQIVLGKVMPGALERTFRSLGNTMEAAFGGSIQQKKLVDLANTLNVVNQPQSGTGKVWIQLAQGGALGELITAPLGQATGKSFRRSALAILLTPIGLAKMLSSPRITQALIDDLQTFHTKPTTRVLGRFVAQMSAQGVFNTREAKAVEDLPGYSSSEAAAQPEPVLGP